MYMSSFSPVPADCSWPCLGKVCQRCRVAPLPKTPTAMTSCEIKKYLLFEWVKLVSQGHEALKNEKKLGAD